MKKIMFILVMVAAFALPTMAQDFQSTSTMQGTGSDYAPQVTEVGATTATDMATTTESYSPAKAPSGPRKIGPTHGGDNPNPLGDAVWPLLAMLAVYGAARVFRRKRRV